jgi:alpha-galactosidase
MTEDEYRAHFSLWAIMAAPLMAGHDVRTMSPTTKEILTNAEVIAVDQDSLGRQGLLVSESAPELQVWAKPLADGSRAVALLNRSSAAAKITASLPRIGLHVDSVTVRDLWAHADRGRFGKEYATEVPPHAVVMLRIAPAKR